MNNPHADDVPVESAEDWQRTVVQPARRGFDAVGVPVADLSDDQVLEASERIVDEFGGETPDLTDIARIVDAVRFKAKLLEEAPADSETEEPGGQATGRPHASQEPAPGSSTSPRSADCETCIPIKIPYPSGWWVVHSKFCPTSPKEKIRPLVGRYDAQQTARMKAQHDGEDARTGLTFGRSRYLRFCDKCSEPTFCFPYCEGCRALFDHIVKPVGQ